MKPWTEKDFLATFERTQRELQGLYAKGDVRAVLARLERRFHDAPDGLAPPAMMRRFCIGFLILRHHARFGGLPRGREQAYLQTLNTLLRLAGITPGRSRLEVLCADCARLEALIAARGGEAQRATLALARGRDIGPRSLVEPDAERLLAEAEVELAAASCAAALAALDAIPAAAASVPAQAARTALLRAKALRLAGDFAGSVNAADDALVTAPSEPFAVALRFAAGLGKALAADALAGLEPPAARADPFDSPLLWIETRVWAWAAGLRLKRMSPSVAVLQRRAVQRKLRGRALHVAAMTLETCADVRRPLGERAPLMHELAAQAIGGGPAEDRLLLLAACIRWFRRTDARATAVALETCYRDLARRASGGLSDDPLRLLETAR